MKVKLCKQLLSWKVNVLSLIAKLLTRLDPNIDLLKLNLFGSATFLFPLSSNMISIGSEDNTEKFKPGIRTLAYHTLSALSKGRPTMFLTDCQGQLS